MLLLVSVNILIKKFIKKLNIAQMKRIVIMSHGGAGTDAIKIVVLELKRD